VTIDGVAVEPQKNCGLGGFDVEAKAFDEFKKPMPTQLTPLD
jgi:hypothetical protein